MLNFWNDIVEELHLIVLLPESLQPTSHIPCGFYFCSEIQGTSKQNQTVIIKYLLGWKGMYHDCWF